MTGWPAVKLKEVCARVTVGHVGPMAQQYQPQGIPFLRSQNIKPNYLSFDNLVYIDKAFHEKLKKSELRPGDLAIVRTGYPGTAAVIPASLPVANCSDLVIVRPGTRVNARYLCYIFNSVFGQNLVGGRLVGAAQQHFNITTAKELKLKLPPLPIQRKIAAVLSAYDDLIENSNRRIAILEKMAEELYREWFVRLRFPGHEKVKIVKGVPEGWDRRRFGQFCKLKRGYDLPDSQVVPGNVPVVAATSVKTYHSAFKVEPPVITTGRSGSLGEVQWINSRAWPLNTSLYVQDFCSNSPYLVFFTLKNMGLENFNSGAGVPSLNRNHLDGISIVVPPIRVQSRFDSQVGPMFRVKENLAAVNEALMKSRDRLLSRLMSGKIDVEKMDIRFPESMKEEGVAHA